MGFDGRKSGPPPLPLFSEAREGQKAIVFTCVCVPCEGGWWVPIHPAVVEFGSRGLGLILRRGSSCSRSSSRGLYCLV